MIPRKALPVLVAVSLLAACSDDDSAAPGSTTPPDTRAAGTRTTDPVPQPTATTATTATAPPGEQAPQVAETTVIDTPLIAGAGQAASVTSLFALGDDRIAVGSVQNLQDGHRRPLVLESPRGTSAWERQPADMPDEAVDAVMTSAIRFGGTILVLGTHWTDGVANGVGWARTPDGFAATELTGAIAQDGSQIVHRAAGSPAGLVATGTDDGHEVLWTSGDGVEWTVPSIEGDRGGLSYIDVAANDSGMLVVATDGDRSVVLFSSDGEHFHVIREAGPRQRLNVAASAGDELVVGGGADTDGRREPRLWRIVDGAWPDSAERGNLPAAEYDWGPDAAVTALAADRGRLLFMVDGTLIAAPRPGVWRKRTAADPSMSPSPSTLVPAPGAATHAETVVGGSTFYTAGDADWDQSTPDGFEAPYRRIELAGVAHREGTWVVAGTMTDATGLTRTVAWQSPDGETWQTAHELQDSRGTTAAAVGVSADGFVVVGDDRRGRRSMLWTSGNGRAWELLTDPELRWPRRTRLHPTSVIGTPSGFAVSGYATRRRGTEPWLARVIDGEVRTATDLPRPRRGVGGGILGSCHPPGNLAFVGVRHGTRSEPAWWLRAGDAPWEAQGFDGAGELRRCLATRRELFAVGTRSGEEVLVDLGGSEPSVSSLPSSRGSRAIDLAFLRDRLVVAGDVGDGTRSGRLWISAPEGRDEWIVVDTPELGGPGTQSVVGVAGPPRGPLIVAIDDGASGRLVAVQRPD